MTTGLDRQRALNSETSRLWNDYQGHRRRVMELINRHAPSGAGRLVILGAGNCNDIDLPELLSRFTELCLVDIDGDAVTAGVHRQGVARQSLVIHGDLDLNDDVDQLAATIGHADVVVSTAALTQLIDDVVGRAGTVDEILRARDHHLQVIAGILSPGAAGILVTDVVSSDTLPQLADAEDGLTGLLENAVASGNFFTGANPFAIHHRLTEAAQWSVRSRGIASPWIWKLGDRRYLVCAVVLERR